MTRVKYKADKGKVYSRPKLIELLNRYRSEANRLKRRIRKLEADLRHWKA